MEVDEPTSEQTSNRDTSWISTILSLKASAKDVVPTYQPPHATVSDFTGIIDRDKDRCIGSGSFGDVYQGKWLVDSASVRPPNVAIKVMRLSSYSAGQEKIQGKLRQLRREIEVWQRLNHGNIVPFYGFAMISETLPSLISLWMAYGTVKSYLAEHPEVSRVNILLGVIRGLEYLHLHNPSIIHGDLKADNILVDETGQPCLCDFGLSRMLDDSTLWNTSATSAPGTTRWKAPELLSGAQETVTLASDMYAYGLTSLEVMTDRVPFAEYRHDGAVITALLVRKERPSRPTDITIPDNMWKMWVKCWVSDPTHRPDARRCKIIMTDICENKAPTPTEELKEAFRSLGDALPHSNQRSSRLVLLGGAIAYIKETNSTVQSLEERWHMVQREIERLQSDMDTDSTSRSPGAVGLDHELFPSHFFGPRHSHSSFIDYDSYDTSIHKDFSMTRPITSPPPLVFPLSPPVESSMQGPSSPQLSNSGTTPSFSRESSVVSFASSCDTTPLPLPHHRRSSARLSGRFDPVGTASRSSLGRRNSTYSSDGESERADIGLQRRETARLARLQAERRRREELRDAYRSLNDALELSVARKFSMVFLVREAVSHIQRLKTNVEVWTTKLNTAETHLQQLRKHEQQGWLER